VLSTRRLNCAAERSTAKMRVWSVWRAAVLENLSVTAGIGRLAVTRKSSAMNRAFHLLLFWLIPAAFVDGAAQAAPQTFLTFHCGDGTEFVATIYESRRSAQLQLDGKALTLPRRLALFGPRYSAGGITLRMKGTAATLSRGRRSTECSSS
jgi:membrane-bound inhibitor of C-type lysozyme